MKPEAQRIEIAEACGFPVRRWLKDDPQDVAMIETLNLIPDYLNDLNATNQMEEHLRGKEWANYFDAIRTWGKASGVRATAAQRCEQFLRAKGKWVEDKQ